MAKQRANYVLLFPHCFTFGLHGRRQPVRAFRFRY